MKVILVLFAVLAAVLAHSYITAPTPRQKHYGCRIGGPPEFPVNCPGPCEVPRNRVQQSRIVQTSRGASVSVEWPRNNHGGGFIRLAWAKIENSDDHQAFTKGVSQISCHETGFNGDPANTSPNRGCASDDPKNPNGGDTGSQEGGIRACKLRYTIPSWLSDGVWTMQWAWYGASGGYLGDYYSCVDFNVAGGSALTAQTNPTFKGGDVNNVGANACSFSTVDRPHYCWKEPCMDVYNATFTFDKYRVNKGTPYLPQTVATTTTRPTQATTTTTQATTATTRPTQATTTTTTPTTRPTQVPITTQPPPVVEVPEVKVTITVSLALAPRLVDTTVFVYELARNLNIPIAAIRETNIDLDQSTATTTIVHFTLRNVQLADGTRVDPIASAYKLKELTADPNSSIKSSSFLSTMEVVSVDEPKESGDFVGSPTFVIIIATVGGVIVLGAIAAVVIVLIKRRKSGGFF